MRGNMAPLSSWNWLSSLNIMSSNCIHFPSNHRCHSSLCMSNIPILSCDKH
jgi:hypothetical protein